MKEYSCIIFDLDGTLIDTSPGILQATDYIIKTFQLPDISDETKRTFIGPPIQISFQKHYGFSQEQAWKLATAWRDVYKEKFLLKATPYDGIYRVLQYLRDKEIKTCVATNKREDYTMELLDHFSFLNLFDCIVGSDFEGTRNKAEMIRLCMSRTGVINQIQCLMIGDTNGDLAAAKEIGIDFLGVTYGFGFSKDMNIYDFPMCSSPNEIADAIEDMT